MAHLPSGKVAIAIALLLVGVVASEDLFVSLTGNDGNDGRTLATAFRTPGRAAAAVAFMPRPLTETITINLNDGTYYLESTLTLANVHSGSSPSAVVHWTAINPGKVIISGGVPIAGWRAEPPSLISKGASSFVVCERIDYFPTTIIILLPDRAPKCSVGAPQVVSADVSGIQGAQARHLFVNGARAPRTTLPDMSIFDYSVMSNDGFLLDNKGR